jgi:cytochrome P450
VTVVPGTEWGLIGAELVVDPYPFYTELRHRAPVFRVPATNLFLVATWALVTEAAGRTDDFSNHFRHTLYTEADGSLRVLDQGEGGAPDVFAGADPPHHTEHRQLFFPELVQERMAGLEPEVTGLADRLLDGLLDRGAGDAATQLADPLPLRIMAERVIGFTGVDLGQLQHWVASGSRLMGGRLGLDDLAAAAGGAAGLWPWVASQLDRARAGDDPELVLGAAATAVRAGALTADEAVLTLMVLLGAGAETTTSLIGNAVRLLAERPAVQDALRANLSLVPTFVEEVLRFESPFRFHPRTAVGPTELGGVEIPDRAMVALLWASANRDDAVFDRPGQFVPSRSDVRRHLGFGRGIHRCVGAPLARLEARVVLTRLLERTQEVVLDPAAPPVWADSLWLRRHDRLPIRLEAR